MKSLFFRKTLLLAALMLTLVGCSTVENSHRQKASMMSAYSAANNSAVMQIVNEKLKEPKWYNSSVINTGDEVMWRLEAGSINFHLGNYAECVQQFKTAEKLISDYDERAKISARNVGAEIGAAVTNLNTLPYRGFCRDRIALSIYKSIAYLGMDDEAAFRAQLRRLRNEQKKVQEDYKKFFEAEKAELDAARKNNPEAAKREQREASSDKIVGNPKNADFAAGLKEARTIANRGYGNFLNPMAIFLSGLGSIRDENYDNARIDFKRLYEAMPQNSMLQKYYVTMLQAANRPVPSQLNNVQPFSFPLNRDCVYVIFANGKTAAFRQIAIYFPIMTAWPMCEFYPAPFEKLTVSADDTQHQSVILADMDGILAQEFNERLPGIIARTVLSTFIKETAYYASLAAIYNSTSGSSRQIALFSTAIAGAAYRVAMNTADTRTWEMLPKEFQLTQFPMPQNRNLTINLAPAGISHQVKLPENCRSAIVFVNAPSIQNISYHVFPLTSK